MVYFFHVHRGKPIASPALFEPIGENFRADIRDWAQANRIPVIRFNAGERKADVMAPYLVLRSNQKVPQPRIGLVDTVAYPLPPDQGK